MLLTYYFQYQGLKPKDFEELIKKNTLFVKEDKRKKF